MAKGDGVPVTVSEPDELDVPSLKGECSRVCALFDVLEAVFFSRFLQQRGT